MLGALLGYDMHLYRWCRQERNVPIAHLAPRRYGRSYTGVSTYPRSYHGCGRRIFGGTFVPALSHSRGLVGGNHHSGCIHGILCSSHSMCTDRYQAYSRILYHLADSIYDYLTRCGSSGVSRRCGLYGINVPLVHTRHVQGMFVLGGRCSNLSRTL